MKKLLLLLCPMILLGVSKVALKIGDNGFPKQFDASDTVLMGSFVVTGSGTIGEITASNYISSPVINAGNIDANDINVDTATVNSLLDAPQITTDKITFSDGTSMTTAVSASGTGGAVSSVFGRTGDVVSTINDYTWAQIDKTVSSIADINLRSHTDLTDIGTNTHTQIDTHIASTSNPHSVTAAQIGAVALVGDESISGTKTFQAIPILPSANPTSDNQAVRKAYVDTLLSSGARFVTAVDAATTAALAASTYNNGASGVGATLTANANGAFPSVDSVSSVLGNLYLVKDQASGEQNGAYELTTLGDGSNPWVLTRVPEYDESSEIVAGTFFNVLGGTEHIREQWALLTTGTVTVGTTSLSYGLLSESPSYTGSNGILLSGLDFQIDLSDTNPSLEISDGGLRSKVDGTTITRTSSGLTVGAITDSNITGSIETSHGGTGLTTIGSANQVLGVSSAASGLEYKSIVGGSNTTVTHTANQIEIATSLTGAADYMYATIPMQSDPTTNFVYTNLPAALTTASTALRIHLDLTGAVQYRIKVNQLVAGFAGSKLRLLYSTNNSTFQSIGAANSGDLDVGTGTGVKVGSWENVVSGSKQDVWLQLYGYSGDGVVDPAFRQIQIEFKYNSTIVDQTLASLIYTESTIHSHPNSSLTWTNMPVATTELLNAGHGRIKRDLTGITHYRVMVNQTVAGFADADFNVQYSLNNSTFNALDTGAAGELAVGTGTGVKYGAWAAVVDGAKQDVWLRIVGKDGNAVVDPAWRQIAIQFKSALIVPSDFTGPVTFSGGISTTSLVSDGAISGTTIYGSTHVSSPNFNTSRITFSDGTSMTTASSGGGGGGDATTLDGLDSLQFLRSDVDDVADGNITFNDGVKIFSGSTPTSFSNPFSSSLIYENLDPSAINVISFNSGTAGSAGMSFSISDTIKAAFAYSVDGDSYVWTDSTLGGIATLTTEGTFSVNKNLEAIENVVAGGTVTGLDAGFGGITAPSASLDVSGTGIFRSTGDTGIRFVTTEGAYLSYDDGSSPLSIFGYSGAIDRFYWGLSDSSGSPIYYNPSGYLGLGTPVPRSLLEISYSGAVSDTAFAVTSDDGATLGDKFIINSAGNVGINKSNPNHKLEVSGEISGTILYSAGSQVLTSASLSQMVTSTSAWSDNLLMKTDAPSSGRGAQASGITISDANDISGVNEFTSTGNMSVDSGTLFVDSSSNEVGVGTTSPTATLDINGSASVSGSFDFGFMDMSKTSHIAEDFYPGSTSSGSIGKYGWYTSSADDGGTAPTSSYSTSATLLDGNTQGVVELTSGYGDTDNQIVMYLGSLGGNIYRLGGGYFKYDALINLQSLSTASEEYDAIIGLCSNIPLLATFTACTNGVYFNYNRNTSANWIISTCSTSGGCTNTTTSTAVAAGSWIKLTAIVNAAGTSASFYVNGTLVGTHSADIPTASAELSGPTFSIYRSAGSSPRSMYIDYWSSGIRYTTAR